MLTVVMDDSGSDGSGAVFVLAGYVASDEQWAQFSREWRKVLDKPPQLKYFKMKEANSLRGEFWGWSQHERDAKVSELVSVVKQNVRLGITCSIWWEDFKAIVQEFSDIPWQPYFLLFHGSIASLTQYCIQHEVQGKLDFVFDDQGVAGSRAAEVFEQIRAALSLKEQEILGSKPVHLDDKVFVPLQASDLIAWQTRRYIEENKKVTNLDNLTINSPYLKDLERIPTVYKTYGLDRLRGMAQDFRALKDRFRATGMI